MNTPINTTILAFLLALEELDTSLSQSEKKTLAEIADQLDVQPKAWESFTQPLLLQMIADNELLNQRYQTYKSKLDSLETIPSELLPTVTEIEQLKMGESLPMTRGYKPQTEATGYNQQINNVVIVISRSEHPEATVKKLSLIEKLKQLFD
ncbi:hypothetical protein MC7420_343 [Coleofasciculus chthonoplastes PCC 7420]|uniref:Uncharacterized protein n=1 Tax=Coleofasciculus chthonoplastes PCC 7420 TaxID=118168 RepID=B4VLP1_9CYAN|nr:hypothetical protein [Coleofasciculus chthonoplastes]EDX77206.1 hypothetical protein MC7420_343 [Coleofasciculus chthonoplastes PCC 7420]